MLTYELELNCHGRVAFSRVPCERLWESVCPAWVLMRVIRPPLLLFFLRKTVSDAMIPLVGWRPPDCRGEFSTYFPRDVCLCCTIHLCGESQLPCSLQYHRNSALGPNWTHFLERFSVILLFWALGIMMQSYCSCIWQWNRPVRVLFLVWVRPIHFLAAGLTFGFW